MPPMQRAELQSPNPESSYLLFSPNTSLAVLVVGLGLGEDLGAFGRTFLPATSEVFADASVVEVGAVSIEGATTIGCDAATPSMIVPTVRAVNRVVSARGVRPHAAPKARPTPKT